MQQFIFYNLRSNNLFFIIFKKFDINLTPENNIFFTGTKDWASRSFVFALDLLHIY